MLKKLQKMAKKRSTKFYLSTSQFKMILSINEQSETGSLKEIAQKEDKEIYCVPSLFNLRLFFP